MRAQRGDLIGVRDAAVITRSPRPFAPRDDKIGPYEGIPAVPLHSSLCAGVRYGTLGRANLTMIPALPEVCSNVYAFRPEKPIDRR